LIGESLLDCKKVIFDWWHQFKNGHINRTELIGAIEAGPKEDLRVLLKAGAAHEDCVNKTKATCIDYLTRAADSDTPIFPVNGYKNCEIALSHVSGNTISTMCRH
jgi:hypothetical protein